MIISNIENWVQERMVNVDPGHDYWHVKRVVNNALTICKREGGDELVIHIAALLHDTADAKFFDEQTALNEILLFLQSLDWDTNRSMHVIEIITHLSFSKSLEGDAFDSLEFRIVQDADRLDAMGAIGIARAFSYGTLKNRVFFDPEQKPQLFTSTADYRKSEAPTINHFYEKLLLLKDKMKTPTGKEMAEERHVFMEAYLKQFFKECGFDQSLFTAK